jgi:prepilin-type N-terminal cleavage/methylation domain-containing protein
MKKSFTLIEILVVIVVIGVLSAFILVGMSSITNSANIAKGQAFFNSLRNSLLLNLISEWKFDGNANDSWGANSGTVSGAVLASSGCVKGSCYNFDSTDYIEVFDTSALRLSNGGTISMWTYPRVVGAGRGIDKTTDTAGTNGYIVLPCYTNNRAILIINAGPFLNSSNDAVALNQWSLITATFNSSGRKIYVNGVDKTLTGGGETALPPASPSPVPNIRIGNRAGATDRIFDGMIDEVSIYDAIFSSSQIEEKYYSGLNRLLVGDLFEKKEYLERLSQLKNNLANDNI